MILGRSSVVTRLLILILVLGLPTAAAVWLLSPSNTITCGYPPATAARVTTAPAKEKLLVELPNTTSIGLDEIAPGKPVAIIVMKGTWCPVCRAQLQRLQERMDEIEGAGAVIVGMTTQSPVENETAAAQLGLAFPILSDADWDVIQSFGLIGASHPTPGVVFLDERGHVQDIVPGRYPGRPQEDWIIRRLAD